MQPGGSQILWPHKAAHPSWRGQRPDQIVLFINLSPKIFVSQGKNYNGQASFSKPPIETGKSPLAERWQT